MPRACRPRKRRSQQERNAFGHSLRANRPLALSPTGCLAQFAPAWEEELWCSRPVSALAIQPAKSAIGPLPGPQKPDRLAALENVEEQPQRVSPCAFELGIFLDDLARFIARESQQR